jgi:hypothetical protein
MSLHEGEPLPRPKSVDGGQASGISKRDYFAAQALPAVYRARIDTGIDVSQDSIAQECYELADAMLDEREKQR